MRTLTTIGACAAALAVAAPVQASTLTLSGLQDAAGVTDVNYRVDAGAAAPSSAYVLVARSRTVFGLPWFGLRFHVPLVPTEDPATVQADVAYHFIADRAAVSALMLTNTGVWLHASGPVYRRPDLQPATVSLEDAPVQGHRLRVDVDVVEANGDVGATATVSLLRGDEVLDADTDVVVEPGGLTEVRLQTVVPLAGDDVLTVAIAPAQPRDYDPGNNARATVVSVATVTEHLDANEDLAYLFDLEALPTITLRVTEDAWNEQLALYDANARHEQEVAAAFEFDKNGVVEVVDEIGFRIRGNTFSRRRLEGEVGQQHDPDNPDWHHAHLRIDFNDVHDDQRFHDARGLVLKWFKDDASYAREVYALDLLRRFGVWTTPRSSYARVYIHVEGDAQPAYFGVYQMMEAVDKEFIQDRFDSKNDDGYLFKCLYQGSPADLRPLAADSPLVDVEQVSLDESESVRPVYDLKTNKSDVAAARVALSDFTAQLDALEGEAFASWAEQHIDADLLLRFLAVNVSVGMWDDYWVNGNNFYLYLDERGVAHLVPWDYDNILGTSNLVPNAGTRDAMRWGVVAHRRPLVHRLLDVPAFRDRYKHYLAELIDEEGALACHADSATRILGWHALIEPWVDNDTGEDVAIADVPAWWGNAPFYRLFSGDDSGAAPEANFLASRARTTLMSIDADAHWSPGVQQPVTAALYLRGSYNGWAADEAAALARDAGVYTVDVYFTAATQTLRIADEAWSVQANFGAPGYANRVVVDEPLLASSQDTDPTAGDLVFQPAVAGVYRVTFDGRDERLAWLSIELIDEDEDAEDIVGYGVDVFLRGSFNGWAADPAFGLAQISADAPIYASSVAVAAGEHEFKIADSTWGVVNIGSAGAALDIALGDAVVLANGGGSGNLRISLTEDAVLHVQLDATEPATPTLTITTD